MGKTHMKRAQVTQRRFIHFLVEKYRVRSEVTTNPYEWAAHVCISGGKNESNEQILGLHYKTMRRFLLEHLKRNLDKLACFYYANYMLLKR